MSETLYTNTVLSNVAMATERADFESKAAHRGLNDWVRELLDTGMSAAESKIVGNSVRRRTIWKESGSRALRLTQARGRLETDAKATAFEPERWQNAVPELEVKPPVSRDSARISFLTGHVERRYKDSEGKKVNESLTFGNPEDGPALRELELMLMSFVEKPQHDRVVPQADK